MSDISKIHINPTGTEYNLKDATARAGIESSKTIKSSVVTVNDAAPINAEDITVDITPQQDLHGYDRPWAGGAWKNKFSTGLLPKSSNGITVELTDIGEIWIHGTPISASGYEAFAIGAIPSSFVGKQVVLSTDVKISGVGFAVFDGSINLTMNDTVLSKSAVYNPNGNNILVNVSNTIGAINQKFKVQFEEGSTPTTFAPYSNICPIEGRTGAELDRVGKNLYEGSPSFDGYTNRNSYSLSSETHNGHEVIYKSGTWGGAYKTLILSKGTYTFSVMVKCSATATVSLYDTINGVSVQLAVATVGTSWQRVSATFEVTEQRTADLRINLQTSNTTIYVSEYQLELGSTATAYEPYQGEQYTVSFGETIHGGKWHVTKGGTDKTHGNIANYNGETINEPWLSSMDEYVAGATPTTGAQVVYPLTTPTAISTPKQNVPMLKGINTVSANCGDTQVRYQPDNVIGELKGEIQKANSFVDKMALREGSGAKDFSYGGWSFRLYIYRSMGQISMSLERISASSVTEPVVDKVFNGESDYRAPEELRPNFNLLQAATYTTPSGWAIQVYLGDDGYIMFMGMAPAVGASAPTSSNWNLVEPWATHQQAKDLFNN